MKRENNLAEEEIIEVLCKDKHARDRFIEELTQREDIAGEPIVFKGYVVGITRRLATKLELADHSEAFKALQASVFYPAP